MTLQKKKKHNSMISYITISYTQKKGYTISIMVEAKKITKLSLEKKQ